MEITATEYNLQNSSKTVHLLYLFSKIINKERVIQETNRGYIIDIRDLHPSTLETLDYE